MAEDVRKQKLKSDAKDKLSALAGLSKEQQLTGLLIRILKLGKNNNSKKQILPRLTNKAQEGVASTFLLL